MSLLPPPAAATKIEAGISSFTHSDSTSAETVFIGMPSTSTVLCRAYSRPPIRR